MKCFNLFYILFAFSTVIYSQDIPLTSDTNIPVSTSILLDAVGETGRTAVNSVFMIVGQKTNKKGTGFLIKTGHIITNEHVIRGNNCDEIIAQSSFGKRIRFKKLIYDSNRDIALLEPQNKIIGGLELGSNDSLLTGMSLATWGFPLGYNGPTPLLSVGYLSGFKSYFADINKTQIVNHLIVNGAFNPGNSGGPLLISNTNKVIGIVVSKHAPISDFHISALEALSNNKSGITFQYTTSNGEKGLMVESQIVADLLFYFRDLTQVMIGEAISINELYSFLKENNINF